jgi:hypothetical protein
MFSAGGAILSSFASRRWFFCFCLGIYFARARRLSLGDRGGYISRTGGGWTGTAFLDCMDLTPLLVVGTLGPVWDKGQ